MGDRYILTVTCPKCNKTDDDVYYAPTCGFITHRCSCGHVIDLEEETGITYDDASNAGEIGDIVDKLEGHYEVTCEYCGNVTAYLDEREDGLIECMHCGLEIETDNIVVQTERKTNNES